MNNVLIIILTSIISFFCLSEILHFNNKHYIYLYMIIYVIWLYLILFNRQSFSQNIYTNGAYIKNWFGLVFKNKIVFINLIGNLFLLIPFGIFLKHFNIKIIYAMIITILTFFLIESLQYITKKGIFDLIDVVLNIIGALIGYMLIQNKKQIVY